IFHAFHETDLMERVKNYIEENITEFIHLDTLASEVAKVSLSHLKKIFKEQVGFALRDYINYRKVEYSKALLLQTQTVTDIAYELNFSSSQYFATVFRKYTGLSPSYYQRSYGQRQ
ncbi:MAG: AraC family transcriptional regulator, partial [Spirochaetota bacterium]